MHKDILGQELEIGDRIAYGRLGSGTDHGSLAIGKIVAFGIMKKWYTHELDSPTATVEWETTSSYSMYPQPYNKPKKSTVTKFENMVKLDVCK